MSELSKELLALWKDYLKYVELELEKIDAYDMSSYGKQVIKSGRRKGMINIESFFEWLEEEQG